MTASHKLKWSLVLLLVWVGPVYPVWGQASSDVLEQYVAEGLAGNLALAQQSLTLAQHRQALKAARGMFLPSVGLEARYTRAGGGRAFTLPIGDLFNPVYGTLNDLLQAPAFPTDLENEEIRFLRPREQETRVRLAQPVFDPALRHRYTIQARQVDAGAAELEAFRHDLVLEIKTAYYTYLKAGQVEALLERTGAVLEENARVSERLVAREKATEDVLYRARAELRSLEQQQAEARKNRKLAAAHFNFLLNRPLDAEIERPPEAAPEAAPGTLASGLNRAVTARPELRQIGYGIAAAEGRVNLARSAWLPSLSVVADYGLQGESYALGAENRFWMASAVVRWNLFDGFQKQARIRQAQLAQRQLETQREALEQRIRLQVREAYYGLEVAQASIRAAEDQQASAQRSFDLVSRKYGLGLASQLEFLDARTTLTNAGINAILQHYDYLIQQAAYERAVALPPTP